MSQTTKPPPSLRVQIRYWTRKVIPFVNLERRAEVRGGLRESAQPDFDYFVLVVLSSMIATLGLLTNSGAVIIGAMLVAPLMSPIIGLGLGSLIGCYMGAAFIWILPIIIRALPEALGLDVNAATVEHINFMIVGALIIFFLIAEPAGLARLWQIGKQKLRVWPFPY